jgi:signal transduction histidine kinase/DNA-binding response OmpR family regulator
MGLESESAVRILLVEDHADQAELIRRALERQLPGSEVTVTNRGAECLKSLDEAAYDLLILDYSLPDVNGLVLLREIKAWKHRLPVVMVTGQGDERIAVEAMKRGAADYIIKTGSYLTALPAVIQKAIEQERIQRELAAVQAEVIKRNKELTDLHTLASTLSSSLRLADLLPLALDVVVASVGAGYGGIYLHRPERDEFILSASQGLSAAAFESFPERVSAGEGVIGTAALDRKTISTDGSVVVPFSAKRSLAGVLFVGRSEGEPFSPEQERLLELMGSQVGAAAENARLYERAEKRARKLKTLNEVSRQLSAAWRLDDLLPGIAEAAARLVGIEAAGLRLLEGDELVVAALAGEAEKVMTVPRLKIGESLSGQAIVERRPVQYADLEEAPSCLESIKSRARAEGFTSALAVPILSGDRAIGALCLFTRERREFTLEDISLLSTFTDQAAVAIENARLYAESESRRRVAEALADVGRVLSQTLDPDMVAQRVNESVREILHCQASVLYRLDPESGDMVSVAADGEAKIALGKELIFQGGTGVCGVAVKERRPVATPNLLTDPRITLTSEQRGRIGRASYRAALGVPLVVQDRVIGALGVGDREGRVFTDEEIRLARTFADQAALALESARLYREARQALEDLQRTQSQLIQSEKLRALGEMAGGVAHDFNNLLAIILGRAQYLKLRQGELTPEDVQRCLGIIERASLDGAETIRRLMSFTRATPRSREAEAMNPNEILDYVAEASRPRWKDEAEAKGKQIQMAVEKGDVPWVEGQAAEIIEVMLNLVFNAIEAMPEGGRITLKSWTEGETICLAVKDTGIGMPGEVIQKIFEPFFTTKGPQRSGLGLSVSYGIIRRHGGELAVESKPGRGTTFTIRLPLKPATPRQAEEAPEAPQLSLRILVADDEADVRETLSEILRSAGHTVLEAEDGKEAIEILAREPVDLVCTDLGMPGMTGWEVADQVKAGWPGLKVALITGWGAGIEPEDLEAHGVDLLIAKPFQIKEILHGIAELGSGSTERIRYSHQSGVKR